MYKKRLAIFGFLLGLFMSFLFISGLIDNEGIFLPFQFLMFLNPFSLLAVVTKELFFALLSGVTFPVFFLLYGFLIGSFIDTRSAS